MTGKKNFLLVLITTLLISLCLLIKNNRLYDDEPGNFAQIKIFLDGKLAISPGYPQYPGFPFIIANLGLLTGQTGYSSLRLINFIFGLSAIFIFYKLAVLTNHRHSTIKTIQFIFLPILFPYIFLLYSENMSNLLVLSSLYLVLKKKYNASLFLSVLSVAIRQTNIIWLFFIYVYIFLDRNRGRITYKKIISHITKHWPFLIGILGFIAAVLLNHGIAMGNQSSVHPSFYFGLGNVYWSLLLFFFLFLPTNISNYSSITGILKKNHKLIFSVLLFILITSVTFTNSHPWNQYPEHLRNRILLFFTSSFTNKIMFFTIIAYSLLSLSLIKLKSKKFYFFYPFSFLALAPLWLIESRYSIIPIILFILFRREQKKTAELITCFLFAALSLYFYWIYLHQSFYL